MQDRHELDHALASRQAVAKLLRRREGGRAGRQDFQARKRVRSDLQQAARIGKLLDLVQQHVRLPHRSEKGFRTAQSFRYARRVVIQKIGVGQALCQHRFANPLRQLSIPEVRIRCAVVVESG